MSYTETDNFLIESYTSRCEPVYRETINSLDRMRQSIMRIAARKILRFISGEAKDPDKQHKARLMS